MKNNKFEVGEVIEYLSVGGIIHVSILAIKKGKNGEDRVILNTRFQNLIVVKGKDKGKTVNLSKNVSVLMSRIKKI